MTSAAIVSASVVALRAAEHPHARRPRGGKAEASLDIGVLALRARVAVHDADVAAGHAEPHTRCPVARRAVGAVDDIDHALVRAIARGGRRAMRTLFARHQTRVYRFIKRIVRDHEEAEDLTSEVFLTVWRRADCFEGRSRVSTWLCGIARNKALAHLEAALPICHDREVMLTVRDPAPGPEGELHAKQGVKALRRSLAALSHEHREIIDLVYFRGKSIKEIADMLGIGPNTVKTRMFYARKRLAGLMAAAGV
jgi:RNA polymerase sigma-70 factor, ECF subfamily